MAANEAAAAAHRSRMHNCRVLGASGNTCTLFFSTAPFLACRVRTGLSSITPTRTLVRAAFAYTASGFSSKQWPGRGSAVAAAAEAGERANSLTQSWPRLIECPLVVVNGGCAALGCKVSIGRLPLFLAPSEPSRSFLSSRFFSSVHQQRPLAWFLFNSDAADRRR